MLVQDSNMVDIAQHYSPFLIIQNFKGFKGFDHKIYRGDK